MSTIATLTSGQPGDTSRTDINNNFSALNADKLETSAYVPATTSTLGKAKASVAPADSANPIFVGDNDPRVPTTAEKARIPTVDIAAAQAGTSGTPNASNPYATKATTDALAAEIDALESGLISINRTFTAGGNIEANDSVYLSASNTVKQLDATGFSPTALTVLVSSSGRKQFPYSNTIVLEVIGPQFASNSVITAYSKDINTAETTLSNPASVAIETTTGTDGAYIFDSCVIGTGKILTIWQKETGSDVPSGIFVNCATFNGSTWTSGSDVVIEGTGVVTALQFLSCSKLDTDKCLILYRKDSDSTLYGQVLTVSGNTITTNTPAQISSRTGFSVISEQIDTNSVLVNYVVNTANYARVITVSGTTITVGAENTLTAQSTGTCGGIAKISTTKFLWCTTTAGTNINTYFLTISGNTVTNGSSLTTSAIVDNRFRIPIVIIGTTMALISGQETNPTVSLLDITGSTPALIQSTAMVGGNTDYQSSLVKMKPWTYLWSQDNDNTILKLTPQTLRVGTAPSAIASAATGSVSMRYQTATLSGLTVGQMYIDDDAQPTVNSSLSAPVLGTALTTTTILLS